jgi:hypothetical protein
VPNELPEEMGAVPEIAIERIFPECVVRIPGEVAGERAYHAGCALGFFGDEM